MQAHPEMVPELIFWLRHDAVTEQNNWAKHPLKKAEEEKQGATQSVFECDFGGSASFQLFCPFCVCITIEIHSDMYAYACIYPKGEAL